jgi:hypothetical protein
MKPAIIITTKQHQSIYSTLKIDALAKF